MTIVELKFLEVLHGKGTPEVPVTLLAPFIAAWADLDKLGLRFLEFWTVVLVKASSGKLNRFVYTLIPPNFIKV